MSNERIRADVADIGRFFERIGTKTNDVLAVVMEATGFYFWIKKLSRRGTLTSRSSILHRGQEHDEEAFKER